MNNQSRVILPKKIWEDAQNKEDFKRLVAEYMESYSGYKVIELGKYYAVCDIGR